MSDLEKFDKQLAAVDNGLGLREDTMLTLQPLLDSQHLMNAAPLSISLLGTVLIVSCQKDVDLRSKHLKNQFIKYPHSLNATLSQLSQDGYDAFLTANTNMDKIRLKTANVQNHMKYAVRILFNGTNEERELQLPTHLKEIQKIADACQGLAENVDVEFTKAMELIKEIQQALSLKQADEARIKNDLKKSELLIQKVKDDVRRNDEERRQEAASIAARSKDLSKAEKHIPGTVKTVFLGVVSMILPGNSNLVKTAQENAFFRVETAKEQLKTAETRYDKANEQLRESNEKLSGALHKMANLKLAGITFEEIIGVLRDGIKAMSEVKKAWTNLVILFKKVSSTIEEAMCENLRTFGRTADSVKQMADRGAAIGEVSVKNIYDQAMVAHCVSFAIQSMSAIYCKVSEEHIMPSVSSLHELLAFDPVTDQDLMDEKRQQLNRRAIKAQDAIEELNREERLRFKVLLDKRLARVQNELESALPAIGEKRKLEIKEAVQEEAKKVRDEEKDVKYTTGLTEEELDNLI